MEQMQMELLNANKYLEYRDIPVPYVVKFTDERNRSKLISFLDRVGSYTGYDKDMKIRIFVASDGDFCAFEAIDYNITFINTTHKLIDFLSDCRVMDDVSISQLRSMIGNYQ